MAGDAYRVQEFVEDAKRIVGRCEGPESTVQFLGPLLERLVSRPDCLADLGGSASPDESFDIHRADDITIRATVWQPNIGAPAHNHNGWAMVGVIEGHERNTAYRRVDDGSRPWKADLQEAGIAEVAPGQSAYVIPPNDVHAVAIPYGKTVAIHVFGNDIHRQWRCTFDVASGHVSPFVPR